MWSRRRASSRTPFTRAFLDIRPRFPGHILLIPRSHYETPAELPAPLVAPLFEYAILPAGAVESGLGAERSFVAVNSRVSQGEIAEALDMTEEEVKLTMVASDRHISSDAPFSNVEDMTLMDVLSDPANPLPDNLLMRSSLSIEIKRAFSKLSQRESDTLILFYGIGLEHAFTIEEIAEKYDLTRERVRQIKDKAIRRLRAGSTSKILKTYLG